MATKNHFLNIESTKKLPGASTSAPSHAMSKGMARKDPRDPTYNKTPAPVEKPDWEKIKSTSWGREGYGANGYGGPSSLTPGQQVQQGGIDADIHDPALDRVQATGLKDDGVLNDQLRDIGNKNCPDAFGAESARSRQASTHSASSPKVPSVLGKSEAPLPKLDQYNSGVK